MPTTAMPTTDDHAFPFSRRTLLTAAGAAVAAAATARTGLAQEGGHEHHAGADHGVPKNAALAESALDCVRTGEDCLEHCLTSFTEGDTSLARCASLVRELVISCTALAQMSAHGSQHLALFARAAQAVCADCEKECRKHAHHKPCMACAESCAACVKQCEAFAA